MTEKEANLRKERDELYQKYRAKEQELNEYRNEKNSGVLQELNKKYRSRILRIRMFDRGLSPLVKRERIQDFRFLLVKDVKSVYDDDVTFSGYVLDLFRESTYLDVANHLTDSQHAKCNMSYYNTDSLRVSVDEIDDSFDLDKFEGVFTQFDEVVWKLHNEFHDRAMLLSLAEVNERKCKEQSDDVAK